MIADCGLRIADWRCEMRSSAEHVIPSAEYSQSARNPQSTIEIGQVRMSFAGGAPPPERAENISRLAMEQLRLMIEERGSSPDDTGVIESLSAGPVRVSLDTMDDDEIARASAAELFRALQGEI
jgi:hypothetical protein